MKLFMLFHPAILNEPQVDALGRKVDPSMSGLGDGRPSKPQPFGCALGGLALPPTQEHAENEAQPEHHAHGLVGILTNDPIRGVGAE